MKHYTNADLQALIVDGEIEIGGAKFTESVTVEADISAGNISAYGNISARNISARNISADGNIRAKYLKIGGQIECSNAEEVGRQLRAQYLAEGHTLPDEQEVIEAIKAAIIKGGLESLNMDKWHTCADTHCVAGHSCVLFPELAEIERNMHTSQALYIGAPSLATIIYSDNATALAALGIEFED